jgi:hypothetical protein
MLNCGNCGKRIGFLKRYIQKKDYQAIIFECFIGEEGSGMSGRMHFCSNKCVQQYLEEHNIRTNHPTKLG